MATILDKLSRATDSSTDRPIIATLAAPGKTVGAPSVTLSSATNWTTATPVYVALYTTTAAGVKDPTSQTDWKAILTGTTLSNMTITGGVDRTYSAGAYVEITFTAGWAKDMYDWMNAHGNADGTLKTTAVQNALSLGAGSLNGWNALGYAPNTVTNNGNRSYDLVFNGNDLTSTLSAGMRLRTTRTVAAPTQCTSLNGTTQYFSKTSPAGMTFTDDFVAGAWIKLSSYPSVAGSIISRYNGTSGWDFGIAANGQLYLAGYNASSANQSVVNSYQSVPLNKWVHVVAQLDMSGFTTTPIGTISYVMIDGVDVPAQVTRAGTNPTALVQAGNLEIGSRNLGTQFFPGKIAQAFVASAKITQANVRTLMSQGLTTALCTANNIVSAYSFNASTSDITVAANNLTASGLAVATNADSPFGTQADGTNSTTLDYAIIQKASFSTNTTITVQVPEGGTIPTSGGVASVVYSSAGKPYGMPITPGKWSVLTLLNNDTFGSGASGAWYTPLGAQIAVPTGKWLISYSLNARTQGNPSQYCIHYSCLSTSATAANLDSATLARAGNDFPTSGTVTVESNLNREVEIENTTQTTWYVPFNPNASNIVTASTGYHSGSLITAKCAYL